MGETESILVPVMARNGVAVHVLDTTLKNNKKWAPGEKGLTLCGRSGVWFFSGVIMEGDRPCKQCDSKASVAVEMFMADAKMRDLAEVHLSHVFESWVQYGINAGFISPSFCYAHEGVPLTAEEIERMRQGGSEQCIIMVRVHHP